MGFDHFDALKVIFAFKAWLLALTRLVWSGVLYWVVILKVAIFYQRADVKIYPTYQSITIGQTQVCHLCWRCWFVIWLHLFFVF